MVNYIYPLRGLQAVLAIIILGLMSYVTSWWTTHWRQMSPTEINFLIFTPSFSLLSLLPLILVPLKFERVLSSSGGRWAMVALEGVSMIMWFSGFVALAVFLSGRICFGMVCDVARASTGLGALSWVLWTATFVLGLIKVIKGGSLGVRAPAMKQVNMHQGV